MFTPTTCLSCNHLNNYDNLKLVKTELDNNQANQFELEKTQESYWTVIVITSTSRESSYAFYSVLRQRQRYGLINKNTTILTVDDSAEKLGSGGATLNALLRAAEQLSAKAGYSMVNSNVLQQAKILILHTGRTFPYDSCHRLMATLPIRFSSNCPWLWTNLDLLLHDFNSMVVENETFYDQKIPGDSDIHAFATMENVDYASKHGTYKLNNNNIITDILYRAPIAELNKIAVDNKVPIVSSIVYFSPNFGEKLLGFHSMPPLDGCTYEGLDSGSKPNQLSLYFDFLMAACSDVTYDRYLAFNHQNEDQNKQSKAFLWTQLNEKTKLTCGILPESSFCYIESDWLEYKQNLFENIHSKRSDIEWNQITHSLIQTNCLTSKNSIIINSIVQKKSVFDQNVVIQDSIIGNNIHIGENCFIKGVDLSQEPSRIFIPSNIILQRTILSLKTGNTSSSHLDVYTILGTIDNVDRSFRHEQFTILNMSWTTFSQQTKINESDLWPDIYTNSPDKCTLFNAKLYPIFNFALELTLTQSLLWLCQGQSGGFIQQWKSSMRLSLEEILNYTNIRQELQRRRDLYHIILREKIIEILLDKINNQSYLPLLKQTIFDGYSHQLLKTLDTACLEYSKNIKILSKLFSAIANALAYMAGENAGLRSGPYLNKDWLHALVLLENQHNLQAVQHLIRQRHLWLDRPDLLIRAARHYDGATQTLIKQAVLTCRQRCNNVIKSIDDKKLIREVLVECSARLDLSGGWTDTPPVCYEHGGHVVNVGILLNNKRPVGARALLDHTNQFVTFVLKGNEFGETEDKRYILKSLTDFQDYNQPHIPCALLKTCCIFTGIIDLTTDETFEQQLKKHFLATNGLILEAWSNIPYGSGLGTSSILAGAILLALWHLLGVDLVTNDMIIHGVLVVEQMMTTGGGWQDQLGGLLPGFKLGMSRPQLPLHVEWKELQVSNETMNRFDERLILLYTGQTRLARNLLQCVLRNWYSGSITMKNLFDDLEKNAMVASEAIERGDITQVGQCMSIYWKQKLMVAPGAEPETCRRLIDLLTPYISGCTLAGAGGGGFLTALAKTSEDALKCKELIQNANIPHVSYFEAKIDRVGPNIKIN
ncbi:unnamed protein product [Didymodactylos carnosus]|uniref:Fucokinase n=1 Tax=Didymodactylos carnosus TaxID=1234261 RepID=A0A814CK58_9BILA|nr:unnamed protein product [Didymodactylos carnosus]CAF0943309.1 unnamed protein product [Didymodactylos carnosus]CAF3682718.1 unnamed protein product [Didymodactylos carnosus]CAF3719585.1 unnamed protein product [Didymodactylos carnosus]